MIIKNDHRYYTRILDITQKIPTNYNLVGNTKKYIGTHYAARVYRYKNIAQESRWRRPCQSTADIEKTKPPADTAD